MNNKSSHGGARQGSGRKPLGDGDVPTTNINIRVTMPQKEKLQRLGGAVWIRDKIDRARLPTPGVLYHATSMRAAAAIDRAGFADAPAFNGAMSGVFLSDRPLTLADAVSRDSDVYFQVRVPAGVNLRKFEVIEDDRPAGAYREWLVPSAVLNEWPRERYIEPEEEG